MLKQMYHISRSKVIILDTYCYLISNLKHKKDLVVIEVKNEKAKQYFIIALIIIFDTE